MAELITNEVVANSKNEIISCYGIRITPYEREISTFYHSIMQDKCRLVTMLNASAVSYSEIKKVNKIIKKSFKKLKHKLYERNNIV